MVARFTQRSRQHYDKARGLFSGGVNSPVRAFGSVGSDPVYIDHAREAYVWDVDGNKYIDYVGSWGPMIVGHAHPKVLEAVKTALDKGISFGTSTAVENELAEKIQSHVPSMEKMRLVSSGTEACMSALRLARAYTGRNKIVKFNGCYHGHADMLLVKAGSGAMTLGLPDSPGVPEETTKHTLTAPYNDLEAAKSLFQEHGSDIAAVIVEPIVGNSGFIRPEEGFLEGLRSLCDGAGSLLVFDEVMTGFRVDLGGVQGLKGIRPDLTTLGKVIGGGLPTGAYGGRREIMEMIAPEGPVYQGGTLAGNPVGATCGVKTLELLEQPGAFSALRAMTEKFVNGIRELSERHKIPFAVDGEGGMFGCFFRKGPVRSVEDAKASNKDHFNAFYDSMLERGVFLAPSPFEAGFVSLAHTSDDIDQTLAAADEAFGELSGSK